MASRGTSSSGRRSSRPPIVPRAGIPLAPRGPAPRSRLRSTVSAWSSSWCARAKTSNFSLPNAAYRASRADASFLFATRTRRTASGTPRRLQSRRQKRAHWSALGLSPWCTCTARKAMPSAASACSSTTESTPPESPTRKRLLRSPSIARRTAAGTLALPGFLELAIAHEPFQPGLHQLFRLHFLELLQRFGERPLECLEAGLRIAMCAAEGLRHDLVDQAERLQPARRDAERFGRLGRHVGAAPQDRGAAFRRDHRIGGVLHHEQLVADRDGERAAGTALANNGGDDRRPQSRHLEEVATDRLGLASLLGIDAGIRARGVDEREDRQREFLGELHQPQGLAIALGLGHAEVAGDLLLRVAAFLMADHHARLAVEAGEAADYGGVVGESSVAVQLFPVREERLHIVERVRALRMARNLRHLPGRQLAVDVLGERLAALREPLDLLGDVDRRVVLYIAQFLDTLLELRDRLLELEEGRLHNRKELKGRSVFYWDRVERAPQVPGGHRAPGPPLLAEALQGARRDLAAFEVSELDALLQAEIVQGKHVGPQEVEDQEHLGRPAPDAAHLDQLGDDVLVRHVGPSVDMNAAIGEVLREVGDVFDLAIRQAARPELGPLAGEHTLRRDFSDACAYPIPDALRRLHRDLLAANRAGKRHERLAALGEKHLRMLAHDARHGRILPGEGALRAVPVVRLHAAAG